MVIGKSQGHPHSPGLMTTAQVATAPQFVEQAAKLPLQTWPHWAVLHCPAELQVWAMTL
jgi:hypothetical protein